MTTKADVLIEELRKETTAEYSRTSPVGLVRALESLRHNVDFMIAQLKKEQNVSGTMQSVISQCNDISHAMMLWSYKKEILRGLKDGEK